MPTRTSCCPRASGWPSIATERKRRLLEGLDDISLTLQIAGRIRAYENWRRTEEPWLIDLAKPQPGKLTYASAGNGTLNHLIGEMLQRAAGIELTHVAYFKARCGR